VAASRREETREKKVRFMEYLKIRILNKIKFYRRGQR
jgi:hypothetical protein